MLGATFDADPVMPAASPAAVSAAAEALAKIQYGNRALAHLYAGSWEDFADSLLWSTWLAGREADAADRGALDVAGRILRLHRYRAIDLVATDCALSDCNHDRDGCPKVATAVCGHCAGHSGPTDDWIYVSEAAIWPCATVRAIAPDCESTVTPDSEIAQARRSERNTLRQRRLWVAASPPPGIGWADPAEVTDRTRRTTGAREPAPPRRHPRSV